MEPYKATTKQSTVMIYAYFAIYHSINNLEGKEMNTFITESVVDVNWLCCNMFKYTFDMPSFL